MATNEDADVMVDTKDAEKQALVKEDTRQDGAMREMTACQQCDAG